MLTTRGTLHSWINRFLLMCMLAYAAGSLWRGIGNAIGRGTGGQDFAPVYKASRVWLHRENPYSSWSSERWMQVTRSHEAPPIIVPIAYSTIYPPIALINVAPFAALEWSHARAAWLAVNIFWAILIPILMRKLWYPDWNRFQFALLLAFWLGGLALRVGLGLGQHQLIVFATFLLALVLLRNGHATTSGAFLALTLHKFTFPAVFVPMLFARRAYRALAYMLVVSVASMCCFLLLIRPPMLSVVSSYASELRWWFEYSEAGGLPGFGPSHFFPILLALSPSRPQALVIMYGLVAAGVAIQFWLAGAGRCRAEDLATAGFVALSFWSTYHGIYDGVFLILPLCALVRHGWNLPELTLRWVCRGAVALLVGLWFVDQGKITAFIYQVRIEDVPRQSAVYLIGDVGCRATLFSVFWILVALQWHLRRRSASAPALEALAGVAT
jgi:hypothetical protein